MSVVPTIAHRSLQQIDFIMVYMQAPIESDFFIESPYEIEMTHGNIKDYILQLLENTYG